uniref:J domain-containing protein n=1 Tax=Rhabditophanes sp. KR3021 TaxID=114890 RepID=A0AC35TS64_9BILA
MGRTIFNRFSDSLTDCLGKVQPEIEDMSVDASTTKVVVDYYELLGVSKSSTENEIKNAYRKLALKYHPDRNPNNLEAQEMFKNISVAYSVLSDPSRKRQYDVSGPSENAMDFDGIDISEVGNTGRFFGALFSKLGVPIPTTITPKILGTAKDICCNEAGSPDSKILMPGTVQDGVVAKQDGDFYKFKMTPDLEKHGVVIRVTSTSMSKFKLIIFDKEGGVRQIQESQKRKAYTSAELFYVPFKRVDISEFVPMKYYMEDKNKDIPIAFHYLDTLENQDQFPIKLGDHVICVYGDNWIQKVTYKVSFLPLNEGCKASVDEITGIESLLSSKKQEMSKFQNEYVDLKKKWEAAKAKLKAEDALIQENIKLREKVYDELYEACQRPYENKVVSNRKGSKGSFFSNLFGS